MPQTSDTGIRFVAVEVPLLLKRRRYRAPVTEVVTELDLGVVWSPGAPCAALTVLDSARAALAMYPREDDADHRNVVLSWDGVRAASMSPPNDEAISGHRLYDRGLSSVLWVGTVADSEWIANFERMNRVHDRHDPTRYAGLVHYVVLLKECVVEVIAEAVAVSRVDGCPSAAAAATAAM